MVAAAVHRDRSSGTVRFAEKPHGSAVFGIIASSEKGCPSGADDTLGRGHTNGLGACSMATLRIPVQSRNHSDLFALVDEEDFTVLSVWKWKLHKDGYAYRTEHRGGTYVNVYMHRVVAGVQDTRRVDHINRVRLDNRRENLRPATHSQNLHNSGAPRTNTSGHKGVYWDKRYGRWCAQIKVNGRHYHLGYHRELDAAIAAYKEGRRRLLGEFA